MTRSYRKNIRRTFKHTKSRFIAIFSIIALGVGFLAGLNATPVDMKESMEAYMDDANFYDIRIVSTLGLTDDDVSAPVCHRWRQRRPARLQRGSSCTDRRRYRRGKSTFTANNYR